MNDNRLQVDYIVLDDELARAERQVRRANINTIFALALVALIFIADRL